ncbi:hypothetical protein D9613_011415 [Agrocybe pediades]|uniref:Glucose-methanol-choline oxidoreductase C-terminal domain-containing protein n=1 Tax=Agrocybe pediades TaxID=84607 RepID=A0A8H4QTF6_9AGAR|nr:hypothetical protein D9613_011415 [Agrocybe pediades]
MYGSVKLASNDPFSAPIIDPGYVAIELDKACLRDSVEDTKHFVPGSAWEDYVLGPYDDTATITDEETDTHVRELATVLFHPVNTTSMTKARALWGVITPDLKLQAHS